MKIYVLKAVYKFELSIEYRFGIISNSRDAVTIFFIHFYYNLVIIYVEFNRCIYSQPYRYRNNFFKNLQLTQTFINIPCISVKIEYTSISTHFYQMNLCIGVVCRHINNLSNYLNILGN